MQPIVSRERLENQHGRSEKLNGVPVYDILTGQPPHQGHLTIR
jgi:hypothetical protein